MNRSASWGFESGHLRSIVERSATCASATVALVSESDEKNIFSFTSNLFCFQPRRPYNKFQETFKTSKSFFPSFFQSCLI